MGERFKDYSDISDQQIARLAEQVFGVKINLNEIGTPIEATQDTKDNQLSNLGNRERRIIIGGRTFIATDLGAKGHKGVFESVLISSKSVVGRGQSKKPKRN